MLIIIPYFRTTLYQIITLFYFNSAAENQCNIYISTNIFYNCQVIYVFSKDYRLKKKGLRKQTPVCKMHETMT